MAGHRRRPSHRETLTGLLKENTSFRSVTELHNDLKARRLWVGLATVYRLLESMTRSGEVDRISGPRESRYRLCSSDTEHHYPLICATCDAVVEVHGTELAEWAGSAAAEHEFTDIHLTATIAGICPRCQNPLPSHDVLDQGNSLR